MYTRACTCIAHLYGDGNIFAISPASELHLKKFIDKYLCVCWLHLRLALYVSHQSSPWEWDDCIPFHADKLGTQF